MATAAAHAEPVNGRPRSIQCRLRAPRTCDHLDHARHLLARHPAMREEAATRIANLVFAAR